MMESVAVIKPINPSPLRRDGGAVLLLPIERPYLVDIFSTDLLSTTWQSRHKKVAAEVLGD